MSGLVQHAQHAEKQCSKPDIGDNIADQFGIFRTGNQDSQLVRKQEEYNDRCPAADQIVDVGFPDPADDPLSLSRSFILRDES